MEIFGTFFSTFFKPNSPTPKKNKISRCLFVCLFWCFWPIHLPSVCAKGMLLRPRGTASNWPCQIWTQSARLGPKFDSTLSHPSNGQTKVAVGRPKKGLPRLGPVRSTFSFPFCLPSPRCCWPHVSRGPCGKPFCPPPLGAAASSGAVRVGAC